MHSGNLIHKAIQKAHNPAFRLRYQQRTPCFFHQPGIVILHLVGSVQIAVVSGFIPNQLRKHGIQRPGIFHPGFSDDVFLFHHLSLHPYGEKSHFLYLYYSRNPYFFQDLQFFHRSVK